MALMDAKIRNLKPRIKPYKVGDFEGLYVLVTPTGSKLWNVKYRLDGRERKLSLGAYPAITLAQARQAKKQARALIARGIDPADAKQDAKRERREIKERTFEKVGQAFLGKQRKERKSEATLSKTEYHLKLANTDFGQRPISEITAPMIFQCLRKV